jgi:2-polyprenyl-6-methoxyphenol hydroxylase-like FAD-dependent oxidoreductase
VSFAEVDSPYPFALMLPQSETERLLEEHLARQGLRIERQVEVTSFIQRKDGVTALLRHADGCDETIETEWLAGCDGAHSTVRHSLGMSFEGNTLQSNWILADVHLTGFPFPESEIATYWHEKGVLVFFPISPGRFRVIANVDVPDGAKPAGPTLGDVQKIMDERGPGGIMLSEPIWLAAFRINERKVTDYRSGRVFLAGDAAHVHSPAGGQGMNTGMQDAFNLAWKLALVCHETCGESLLDSYNIERSAVGKQVLTAAGRLTALAVMKSPVAQTVRDLLARVLFGLAPVERKMVETMTEVSIGYAQSPLNGAHVSGVGGPRPGQRVRPIAGQTPPGTGNRPRFALFAERHEAIGRLLAEHAGLLDSDVRPAINANGVWLVRPDGYVACVARRGELQPIADYLRSVTRVS